jgi:Protein of unknown function (DUF3000)
MTPSTLLPEAFARAVTGLQTIRPRPEIVLEEVPAPQRLAPYSHAIGAVVMAQPDMPEDDAGTGRLILLYDPAGHEAWDGTMRLVTYVTAELEPDLAADPLLPGVGWSWLIDALETHGAAYTALGGTVTQTISTRFGDLAGPPTAADVEIRASWTPRQDDLKPHVLAWLSLLASTAGLPPPGVTALPDRRRPGSA